MNGDTMNVFTALGYDPAATTAVLDYRNNHAILKFAHGVDLIAVFTGVLPCQYAGGNISAYLHYSSDEGTAIGNFTWTICIERIGNNFQDIDSDSFGAEGSIVTAPPTTGGNVLICNTIVSTDGFVVGDSFRCKVKRYGTTDNAEVEGQLLAIELREV